MPQIQAGQPSPGFFLDGNFSPVCEERDTDEMEAIGEIPDDLQGHFLRVGPNPVLVFSEAAYHTFAGDGMIHAIEFGKGTAPYRNRFIRNEGFELEQARGDWVYKGMNSLMDPAPSRVPEGAPSSKNLATGSVVERSVSETPCDFTRVNDDFACHKTRFAYAGVFNTERAFTFDGVMKYHGETGATVEFRYGVDRHGGEAVSAAKRGGTSEDDGYLVCFVHDEAAHQSECLIIDAQKVTEGPIATIVMPFRVPYSFNAGWVSTH